MKMKEKNNEMKKINISVWEIKDKENENCVHRQNVVKIHQMLTG